MTEIQKLYYEKCKQLVKEIEIFNYHHKLAKRKKQNVIVPLEREVKDLLLKVHGERVSNYNIVSECNKNV